VSITLTREEQYELDRLLRSFSGNIWYDLQDESKAVSLLEKKLSNNERWRKTLEGVLELRGKSSELDDLTKNWDSWLRDLSKEWWETKRTLDERRRSVEVLMEMLKGS